jgi:hypothetical protein
MISHFLILIIALLASLAMSHFFVKVLLKYSFFAKMLNCNKTLLFIAKGLMSLFAFMILFILIVAYMPMPVLTTEFNKKVWDQSIQDRSTMANYLIENDALVGKTREEIVIILGEPFHEGYNGDQYCLQYNLGFVGYVDPDVMSVCLVKNKVVKVSRHES